MPPSYIHGSSSTPLTGQTIGCGLTEASPICNMTDVDDPIELRVSTVGRVLPHQEQKIIDPVTGRILPRGEQGELCYRGYHIMDYKIPRFVKFVTEFPTTVTGKVQKFRMREMSAAELSQRMDAEGKTATAERSPAQPTALSPA